MLKKIFALVKKDLLVETSYKLSFFFNIFGVITSLIVYYFIDRMFGYRMTEHLEEFGVNYFSYVLLNMAFFSYIGVGMGSFSNRVRHEQVQGTLEALLLSPTKIRTILLGMGLWNLMFATFDVIVYVLLGVFLFGIDFGNVNILSTALVLILTVITFSGLGILSASFVLVFKRGNPIGWVINTLEGILGGVYFPVSVMPAGLRFLANFLPITYAIRAMQLSVYKGYSPGMIVKELSFLVLFALILVPLSFYCFRYALKRTRREGSLAQY